MLKHFQSLLIQAFFSFLDSLETKLGKANLEGRQSPLTSTLAAIRERLSGDLRDYPNPGTSAVSVCIMILLLFLAF